MTTIKQTKAINNMVENGGNVSKAMRDAGYSPATAKTPKKLTQSRSWNDLVETYLPENLLLKSLSDDIQSSPGNRKALLELAFKLRGKLGNTENSQSTNIQFGQIVARDRDRYFS